MIIGMETVRTINLTFCRIYIGERETVTFFPDGSSYGAFPHDTKDYRALATRCGYGDDIMRYCVEHELGHAFIGQEVYGSPSRVIWPLAHGKVACATDILHEESLVIDLQAFTRADVLPGSSAPGFSWFALRDRFRSILD